MEELVKYREEIMARFECQKTGNCCRAEGVVYATDLEIKRMAQELEMSELAFREGYVRIVDNRAVLADGRFRPSCFLDEKGGCKVYSSRPRYCKTYPDVPDVWGNDEVLMSEMELCKGLRLAVSSFVSEKNQARSSSSIL